ncbi:MAG: hypothetical protein JSS68_20445 [Actinobacteria bacterium]|nr:hypothetical protein [Actinomycetota bacterium]
MAVAAPQRRSQSQAAPAPSRTAPPEPKKRPRDRPRPGGSGRSAAPATKPARKPTAPKRKAAPARKAGATRKATAAPARRKAAPKRRSPAGVIPIAAGHAGRAAVAVTQLPESGLIHRLTRGRAWIGVLGVLLVGIVALNVVTLSFAASAGKVDERNTELSQENSALQSRVAQKYGQAKLHHEATALGLSLLPEAQPQILTVHRSDVAEAAARLAAAAAGAAPAATTGEESASGEATGAGREEAATGGESATSVGAASSGGVPSEAEIAAMSQAEKNALYEETLANEAEVAATEGPAETVTETPAG